MHKKISCFSLMFFLFSIYPLHADNNQSTDQKKKYEEEEAETDDIWYGPGFYYGVWFENEEDYWGWRGNHWNYPSNRNYYNRDHPIEYHPEDRDGERERSPDEGGRMREGGGGRGGGRGR